MHPALKRPAIIAIAVASAALAAAAAVEAQAGPLFPQSFRVEHHLVQEDGDGTRFAGESVVDTYGGSWIVSERPDGGRLIVDLARREITEVQPAKGTYWTLSFDRLGELQVRLREAQGLAPRRAAAGGGDSDGSRATSRAAASAGAAVASTRSSEDTELAVTEVSPSEKGAESSARAVGAALADRPGVKHLRVAGRDDSAAGAIDVWVDPSVRLTPAGQAAINALETQVLEAPAGASRAAAGNASANRATRGEGGRARAATPAASPARYLAAARAQAGGALPVRTRRPLAAAAAGEGVSAAAIEDVATRVEPLERFPSELAEVPEGLRRVPHPLEATVRFLEEEAARNAAMSGTAAPSAN